MKFLNYCVKVDSNITDLSINVIITTATAVLPLNVIGLKRATSPTAQTLTHVVSGVCQDSQCSLGQLY